MPQPTKSYPDEDTDTASQVACSFPAVGAEEVSTIRVIAPATLAEGYTFDVMVDDEPYTVEVPRGGVKEGQEFEVLYEPHIYGTGGPKNYSTHSGSGSRTRSFSRSESYSQSRRTIKQDDETKIQNLGTMPLQSSSEDEQEENKKDTKEGDAKLPMGRWRTHLLSCCDVLTQSTFWMGFCCTPVLIAQLVTRMGLTWSGRAGAAKQEIVLSFNRIVLAMMITLAFWKIPIIGDFILLCFYLLIVVGVGARVRHFMRLKYKIQSRFPTQCGKRMEDTCCMVLCGCCSAIQMARHTHDDKDFPGHGCTTTGLGFDATPIV